MRRVLSSAGSPVRSTASGISSAAPTRRRAAPSAGLRAHVDFSTRRSWARSSATGGGATSTRSASQRAAASGTFSNSQVTTSSARPAVAQAGDVVGRGDQLAHLRRAGVGVGIEEHELGAERDPGESSMRPSWPPPSTPITGRPGHGPGITGTTGERGAQCSRQRLPGSWPLGGRGGRGRPPSARGGSGPIARPRRAGAAPRSAAASRAALTAPGPPDGQRPDGDPGRHLHDRQQRVDARAAPSTRTGTPSTGRCVLAAVMPGRWAAPPAPAMITSSPPRPAASAYSNSRSGVRWAETTRTSCGTPRAPSVSAACAIVSQSEREPMITPTSGVGWFRHSHGPSLWGVSSPLRDGTPHRSPEA